MSNSEFLLGTTIVKAPDSSVSDEVPVDPTDIETCLSGRPVPDSRTIPFILTPGVCAQPGWKLIQAIKNINNEKQVEYENLFVILNRLFFVISKRYLG
jgi:hypothetical protein